MHKIILQGGGEHARVVLDCLLSDGFEVTALFDPKYEGELFGVPQRGEYDSSYDPLAKAIVAIGDNALRKKVVGQTKHDFTFCLHSSVIFSARSDHGLGCMILHGSIVQARTKIGNHVIINTGASIDHDCSLADFVHVAPGATLCGTVHVGEGTLIGAGATILPGKKIGRWSVVGAGAVVNSDVPDYTIVVGNPAHQIRNTR
jgi:sugar O-acyltransferase (sialic acid O-acetyltransferase NeuD family)